MVLGIIARLSSNVCCFLYPAYASYKALSMAPETSPEAMAQVEKWLMYWAVVGTWTAVEAVIGWTFTWLPFYSIVKALVFVYLSSPQSGGSSYIYRTQLAPFFHEHERDIDAFLASLKGRASTALMGGFGWMWNKAKTQLNVQVPVDGGSNQPAVGSQQPPSFQDPASGAAIQVYGFLSRYAGQYMPVALSALSAATSSTRARGDRDSTPIATQVPESMSMPIPRINSGDPDASIRSRTYQHADMSNQNVYGDQYGQYSNQNEAWRSGPLPTPPSFSSPPQYPSSSPHRGPLPLPGDSRGSSDRLSTHSSQESLGTRSSGSTSATRFAGESYEHVRRDEIADAQAGLGQGTPTGRPGGGDRRRSSWFGWGGGTPTQAKPKAE